MLKQFRLNISFRYTLKKIRGSAVLGYTLMLILVAQVTNSFAGEEGFDFIIGHSACKTVVASNTQNPSDENITIVKPDPMSLICYRKKAKKVSCVYFDRDKNKVADVEFNLVFEAQGLMDMIAVNGGSKIAINTVSNGAVEVSTVALSERPDLNGSRVCTGLFFTKNEFDGLKIKADGKSKK